MKINFNKSKGFWNALILIFSRFSTLVLQLISIPIMARALGASGMGELAYAQSIMQVAAVFIDFGFNATAIRSVKLSSSKPDELVKIFWGILASKFLIFSIVYFFSGMILFRDFSASIIFSGGLFLLGIVLTPVWLYQGLEAVGVYALLQILFRLFSVALIYFYVKDYSDLYLAAFFIFSADFLIGIGCFSYALRCMVPGKPILDIDFIKPQLKSGFDAWVGSLMANLISLSTPFFLKNYGGGYSVVGYYSAADKIVKAFHSVVWPTVQSYHSSICHMTEIGSAALPAMRRKIILTIMFGAVAFCIVCQFLSDYIVLVMYGDKFDLAADYLRVYSFYNVFAALNVCLIYYYYYAYGRTAVVRKLYFFEAIFYFAGLAIFLTFEFSMPVVFVIVASELAFSIFLLMFLRGGSNERA